MNSRESPLPDEAVAWAAVSDPRTGVSGVSVGLGGNLWVIQISCEVTQKHWNNFHAFYYLINSSQDRINLQEVLEVGWIDEISSFAISQDHQPSPGELVSRNPWCFRCFVGKVWEVSEVYRGGKFLDTKIQRSYRSFTGDSSGWVTPARLGGRFLESPIFQSGMMSKIPGIWSATSAECGKSRGVFRGKGALPFQHQETLGFSSASAVLNVDLQWLLWLVPTHQKPQPLVARSMSPLSFESLSMAVGFHGVQRFTQKVVVQVDFDCFDSWTQCKEWLYFLLLSESQQEAEFEWRSPFTGPGTWSFQRHQHLEDYLGMRWRYMEYPCSSRWNARHQRLQRRESTCEDASCPTTLMCIKAYHDGFHRQIQWPTGIAGSQSSSETSLDLLFWSRLLAHAHLGFAKLLGQEKQRISSIIWGFSDRCNQCCYHPGTSGWILSIILQFCTYLPWYYGP